MAKADSISSRLEELIGTTIAGGYRVDEVIGTGGMGVVFAGVQTKLKRPVAIKVLAPELSDSDRGPIRFRREAESVARLDHPNCLQVFDYGTTDEGLHYMVMPRFRGRTLKQLLDAQTIAPRRALQIAEQLLAGLEHAHAQGVVHRDLKPANIFVVDSGDDLLVKIVDFGIAKIVDAEADFQTRTGVMFGTPAYMSPEQAVGEPVDARSDLYALGIVVYRMIAGDIPHRAKTVVDQMRKRAALDIPPLPEPVPSEVSSLVSWLCARELEARCPDAGKARTVALQILESAPASAPEWDEPLPPSAQRSMPSTVVDHSQSLTELASVSIDGTDEPLAPISPVELSLAASSRSSPPPDGGTLADPDVSSQSERSAARSTAAAPRAAGGDPIDSPEDASGRADAGSWRRWRAPAAAVTAVAVAAALAWTLRSTPDPADVAPSVEATDPATLAAPERSEERADGPAASSSEQHPPAGPPQPAVDPPPEPIAEPDLLEKLTRVNTRKRSDVLGFADRHRVLDELRADPRAAALVDLEANAVWDLEQAADAPAPCRAFAAALEVLDGSRDRWARRALRRAKVPSGEPAACREANRRLAAVRKARGSKKPRTAPQSTPPPGTDGPATPRIGEITPKVGELK